MLSFINLVDSHGDYIILTKKYTEIMIHDGAENIPKTVIFKDQKQQIMKKFGKKNL